VLLFIAMKKNMECLAPCFGTPLIFHPNASMGCADLQPRRLLDSPRIPPSTRSSQTGFFRFPPAEIIENSDWDGIRTGIEPERC